MVSLPKPAGYTKLQALANSGLAEAREFAIRSGSVSPSMNLTRHVARNGCRRPMAIDGRTLPVGAAEDVHDLGDLAALVGAVAAQDGVLDAMGDVIAEDFLLGAAERRPHRRVSG